MLTDLKRPTPVALEEDQEEAEPLTRPPAELIAYLASAEGADERRLLEKAAAEAADAIRREAMREAGVQAAREQAQALIEAAAGEPELDEGREALAALHRELRAAKAEAGGHERDGERFNELAAQAEAGGTETLAQALRDKATDSASLLAAAEERAAALEAEIAETEANLAALEADAQLALAAAESEAEGLVAEALACAEEMVARGASRDERLLEAVKSRLDRRRERDFRRMIGFFGAQSADDILRMAEEADLGKHYLGQLEAMRKERGAWVAAITDRARAYAARLAAGENEEIRLRPRAFAVILRADKVLVLDRQGWELQRVVFAPDGADYPVESQSRQWKLGSRDVWFVAGQ